jgi:TPR repeat protein
LYATGEGVATDAIEAHKWFIIASEGGDEAGKKNSIRSEASLSPAQVKEAQRRANDWISAHQRSSFNG